MVFPTRNAFGVAGFQSGDGPRCNTSFVDYLSAENCPCFVSPRKQASREGALSKWAAEAINPRPMCYDTDRSSEESGSGRGTPRPQVPCRMVTMVYIIYIYIFFKHLFRIST